MRLEEEKLKGQDDDFDAQLDRAVRSYATGARAGMEERVLARIAAEGRQRGGTRAWWIWNAAGVAACVVAVIAVTLQKPARNIYQLPTAPKLAASSTAPAVPIEQRKKLQLREMKKGPAKRESRGDAFFVLSAEEVAADNRMAAGLNHAVLAQVRQVSTEPAEVVVLAAPTSLPPVKLERVDISEISVSIDYKTNDKLPGENDEENLEAN